MELHERGETAICPGMQGYPLDERAEAVPLEMIGQLP
jgi:hypothetical protein